MSKGAYLILTEVRWVFLICINSLEMQQFCVGRKKEKPKLCRRKMKHLPKTALSGKTEKSAQLTSQWFQRPVECKASIARRREKQIFDEREKRLKILCQTKMLIFLVSYLHLSRSHHQAEPRGSRHSLGSGASTSGPGLLAKPAQLEPPIVSHMGSWSEHNRVIKDKKKKKKG